MRIRKDIGTFLTHARVCRVATAGGGGMPHAVPVCHVFADGKLYFGTSAGSRKVQNLRANPRAAVLVDLYAEDWSSLKGVVVQGNARLIRRGPEFRKIRALLYGKYPQYPDQSALSEAEDVIVEIMPTRLSSWAIGK